MRLAQIAPVWFPVPPKGYGGTELVVSLLADGLVARGHEVTLFASGGSSTKATLVSPLAEPPDPSLLGNVWYEAEHALVSYLAADGFDLVHDHSGIVGPALAAVRQGAPPVVHTLHGPWTELAKRFYALVDQRVHLVAISDAQRSRNPDVRYAGMVHNGIDLAAYPLQQKKEDYLVFIGRANPDKGLVAAIEVAKQAGLPLKMIVKRNELFEREYWDHEVEPLLTDDVEVLERVPHEVKADVLARARAMVFPIRWAEPFGLVMVEAMACGTPVIAGRAGAAVEVVSDGRTGFLCTSVEEMVDAVAAVGRIDPVACRAWVEEEFSSEAMVAGYERVYAQVVRR